jgi:hypothetical protein
MFRSGWLIRNWLILLRRGRHKRMEILKAYKELKPDAELFERVRLTVSKHTGLHLS